MTTHFIVMKVIYAGSFDPITNGHINIIRRAAKLFSEVYVVIAHNKKKNPLFSKEEKLSLTQSSLWEIANEEKKMGFNGIFNKLNDGHLHCDIVEGLVADFCKEKGIHILIRGLRANTDFEYEMNMSNINRDLSEGTLETVFLGAIPNQTQLSSSAVRELAKYHRLPKGYVTDVVAKALKEKFK